MTATSRRIIQPHHTTCLHRDCVFKGRPRNNSAVEPTPRTHEALGLTLSNVAMEAPHGERAAAITVRSVSLPSAGYFAVAGICESAHRAPQPHSSHHPFASAPHPCSLPHTQKKIKHKNRVGGREGEGWGWCLVLSQQMSASFIST